LARDRGARVPGRLVASAKSWLCHAAVDRTAPILPWSAGEGVPRVSPVEASARILRHLREAWDASFPEPLAAQEVVLTVPASFDAVARELTLAAARGAGFPDVVLLEEPPPAFYAWHGGHAPPGGRRQHGHPACRRVRGAVRPRAAARLAALSAPRQPLPGRQGGAAGRCVARRRPHRGARAGGRCCRRRARRDAHARRGR